MCNVCKSNTETKFKDFKSLCFADKLHLNNWFRLLRVFANTPDTPRAKLVVFESKFSEVRALLEHPAFKPKKVLEDLSLDQTLRAVLPLPSAFEEVREVWLDSFLKLTPKGGNLSSELDNRLNDKPNLPYEEPEWKSIKVLKPFLDYIDNLGVDNLKRAVAYELLKGLPHISTQDDKYIAYTQSKDKLCRDIQTRTKIGRYLNSVMKTACEAAELFVPHSFQEKLNEIAQMFLVENDPNAIAVKFAENNDLDTWERVYRSNKITSCMNNGNYGVTEYDTYRCYCTSAYGLEDNGLRLAYLEDLNRNPVSRAIVYEPDKSYIKVYGDDALNFYLQSLGYTQVREYPDGLELAAIKDLGFPIFPYVDGDLHYADLIENSDNDEADSWVLRRCGDTDLQNVDGSSCLCKCPICDERHNDNDGNGYEIYYRDNLEGECCESCYNDSYEADSNEYGMIHIYDADDIIDVLPYDDAYLNTESTRNYYGIVYSENLDGYIMRDDNRFVFVESLEDFEYKSETVYLTYRTAYELSEKCTWISANVDCEMWVHEDDLEFEYSEEFGELLLPVSGICRELDELREAILLELENRLESETESD